MATVLLPHVVLCPCRSYSRTELGKGPRAEHHEPLTIRVSPGGLRPVNFGFRCPRATARFRSARPRSSTCFRSHTNNFARVARRFDYDRHANDFGSPIAPRIQPSTRANIESSRTEPRRTTPVRRHTTPRSRLRFD